MEELNNEDVPFVESGYDKFRKVYEFCDKYKEAKENPSLVGELNSLENELDEEFIVGVENLEELQSNLRVLTEKTNLTKYADLLEFASNGYNREKMLRQIYDERVYSKKWDSYTRAKERIAELLGIDIKKEINNRLEKIYDDEVIVHASLMKKFNEAGNNFHQLEKNNDPLDPTVVEAKKEFDTAEYKLQEQERSMQSFFDRMPDSLKEKYKI